MLYRRSRSLRYQCRFKLADGSWHRQSTGKASLEQAMALPKLSREGSQGQRTDRVQRG